MADASTADLDRLAGLVERVTFHNEQNGFCVLRLKVKAERELITLIGHAPIVSPGEYASASGHWVTDREHGRQFRAVFVKISPPTTLTGIERYLGSGMVKGVGDWDPIADALLAPDPASITHARGAAFRKFADQTKSDRLALAACIQTSRDLVKPQDLRLLNMPVLVAAGSLDDISGDPYELAAMMPDAGGFVIEGRDHMMAVGDRSFKRAVLAFLERVR